MTILKRKLVFNFKVGEMKNIQKCLNKSNLTKDIKLVIHMPPFATFTFSVSTAEVSFNTGSVLAMFSLLCRC